MRTLSVLMGNQKVGKLIAMEHGKIGFQYSQSWLDTGFSLSPLHLKFDAGVQFPDTSDARIFVGLFGVFADSLPDGWGLLLMNRFFAKNGIDRTDITALDRLAYMGSKAMGAMEFHPETDSTSFDAVDLVKMAEASQRVLNGEACDVLDELRIYGGSPGGARPKVAVAFSADMKQCHSGVCDAPDGYTQWLVKFHAKEDGAHAGAIEKSYADMAEIAGVHMPPTRLIDVGVNRFFSVKRFDRDGSRKIHMHTLAGFAHANFREPSLDYADVLGAVGNLTKHMSDVEQMYNVAIFNVLSGNKDDHAKNFSFIHDGQWRLSPAYDLTYSSGFAGEHITAMMGNGLPTKKEMTLLAREHGINSFTTVIDSVRHAISEWSRIAKENKIPSDVSDEYTKRFNKIDTAVFGNLLRTKG